MYYVNYELELLENLYYAEENGLFNATKMKIEKNMLILYDEKFDFKKIYMQINIEDYLFRDGIKYEFYDNRIEITIDDYVTDYMLFNYVKKYLINNTKFMKYALSFQKYIIQNQKIKDELDKY